MSEAPSRSRVEIKNSSMPIAGVRVSGVSGGSYARTGPVWKPYRAAGSENNPIGDGRERGILRVSGGSYTRVAVQPSPSFDRSPFSIVQRFGAEPESRPAVWHSFGRRL
jgi:hypothetical protein